MNYDEFLKSKEFQNPAHGFKPVWIPDFLFDFQQHIDDWAIRKGRGAIFAECGCGKGQPYGAMVLTPNGWKKNTDLLIGDLIIASDGKAYPIKGIYKKPIQDTWRIWFSDRTSFVVDEDHLHIVRTYNDRYRGKPWRVMSTRELLSCNNLRYGKYKKSRNYDIPVVTPVRFKKNPKWTMHPYVLGVLLGNGCLRYGISLSSADSDVIDRVNRKMPEHALFVKDKKSEYGYSLKTEKIVNHIFRRELKEMGLYDHLSPEKFIPKSYLYAKRPKDRLELLRGLMDTDGYICESGSSDFYSTSKKLAYGVLFLVRSLGGVPTISKKPSYFNGKRYLDHYTVTFSLKTFNPFWVHRKACKWNPNPRDNGRWIDRIEYEKKQKTICLSVNSPDQSYVTENFIVTHNTPMELIWAENILRKHKNSKVLLLTPIAVSHQFVREGEKFGIKVHRTTCDLKKGINTTNYEQLHKFNSKDFIAVIGDECFPPDTMVDVFKKGNLIQKCIKDIVPGDSIFNCSGKDYVKATAKRRINRAVQVGVHGREGFTCSENHPVFTMHGWKCAKDLLPGDNIATTKTTMCLVREDIQTKIFENAEILRSILLSEMANEHSRTQGKSTYARNTCKNRKSSFCLAAIERSKSEKTSGSHSQFKSNGRPCVCTKNDRYKNQKWYFPRMERCSGRERAWNDKSSISAKKSSVQRMDVGIAYTIRKATRRISFLLQGGLRKCWFKNSYRSGWSWTQKLQKTRERQKEGSEIGFVRVDRVEILEQTDHRLDRYRDEKGLLYFYDIEAEQHPSFSVNGMLVHNSSILKHSDAKTRKLVTDFMRHVPYRLLGTATPAPNDFMELGTSAEALGQMTYNQMLGMFFTHKGETTSQWTLKDHAKKRFWQWVSTWAIAMRKPSDLGYDDGKFILPELNVTKETIRSKYRNTLLAPPAVTLQELREERKKTLKERCEKVAEFVPSNRPCLCWCHLNAEGDLLEKIIPDAVQVSGSDKEEVKEKKLIDFSEGRIRVLITKPRIGGFGMNWQHCADVTYFPSWSYESYYQCIRRCWRFGQKNEVNVHIIGTERESIVVGSMIRKERQAEEMYAGIVREMSEFQVGKKKEKKEKLIKTRIPTWL